MNTLCSLVRGVLPAGYVIVRWVVGHLSMCVINNKTHLSNFLILCPLLSSNISITRTILPEQLDMSYGWYIKLLHHEKNIINPFAPEICGSDISAVALLH